MDVKTHTSGQTFDPVILFLGIYFKEKLLKKKNSIRKKDIYCVTPDGEN